MTSDRDIKIIELAETGMSYILIGERFGITRFAVGMVVFRHRHPRVKKKKWLGWFTPPNHRRHLDSTT